MRLNCTTSVKYHRIWHKAFSILSAGIMRAFNRVCLRFGKM